MFSPFFSYLLCSGADILQHVFAASSTIHVFLPFSRCEGFSKSACLQKTLSRKIQLTFFLTAARMQECKISNWLLPFLFETPQPVQVLGNVLTAYFATKCMYVHMQLHI
jgi:hypothetical protein